ncbi:DUF1120 domain-containing protein [Herbaspirillum sp. RV1423]|uniref:DUF1120 domain-containing protein n=1 Tax=Herbaspirillum sp. RV1423 TaxID=1443993 RepID=UPI0005585D02|nr:DUF1120 domain-containing protein [Herbaspirillum sp. RV1423]
MKRLFTHVALTSALCAAAAAHAAPSVELRVTGVIRPAACTPTLGNGGTADYGTISAKSLVAGQYKVLETKQVNLSVTCDAPAKIAIVAVDNCASSRVAGITDSLKTDAAYNFGLGSVANKNIGGYVVSFSSGATADGKAAGNISSKDKGISWNGNTSYVDHEGGYFSFSQDGATPIAMKTLSTVIHVQAVLNRPENLPLTQEVQLDGSTTIEIRYL